MTDDTIISVEKLGKRYSLRHQRDQRYVALRDVIAEKTAGFFKKLKNGKTDKLKSANGAASQDLTSDVGPGFVGTFGRWSVVCGLVVPSRDPLSPSPLPLF